MAGPHPVFWPECHALAGCASIRMGASALVRRRRSSTRSRALGLGSQPGAGLCVGSGGSRLAAGPDRRRGCIRAGRFQLSVLSRGPCLVRPTRCRPVRRRRRVKADSGGGVGVATFGLGGSVLRRVRAGCVWRADPVRAYASAAAGPDRRRGCIRAGRVRPSAPSRGLRLGRPARCSPARRRRRALRGARAPASRGSGRRASGEPCGLRRSGRSSRSRASCPSRSRGRG